MSEVNASEIAKLLLDRLSPYERSIFRSLAKGLGTREIAILLQISRQAVNRHRRRIALVATKVGILLTSAL